MANNHKKHMPDVLPSLKKDLVNAKLFLQHKSSKNGESLYEHLSRVIEKVIDERPSNVVDYFELFSERVRSEKFHYNDENQLEDAYKEPERLAIAKRLLPTLIEKSQQQRLMYVNKNEMKSMDDENDDEAKDGDEEEDDAHSDVIYYEPPPTPPVKDLCELQFYWNLLGIGFPRREMFLLSCTIGKLKMNASISSARFWGKIFGMESEYYIVECTLTQEALDSRNNAIEEEAINSISSEHLANEEFSEISDKRNSSVSNASSKITQDDEIKSADVAITHKDDMLNNEINDDENEVKEEFPAEENFSMNIPQASSVHRTSIEIPAEEIGYGVNRYVYYVCSHIGDEWIELPSATPHQINVSRRMKKYLSGNLDASILPYNNIVFPGTERNYLRAIIARISAGTHVAPKNFYKIDENARGSGEEDDSDDEDYVDNDKAIKVNPAYRPLSTKKLLKLDYWEHIKPEILKQGRIRYFDGEILVKFHNNNNDDDDDDDDDDDEASIDVEMDATENKISPEMPVPLFTSCSGDRLTNDIISPWTIRLSDVVESPLILLQSNIWPGAFAFVKERICDNIYIGFGHKNSTINYSPLAEDKANDLSVDWEEENHAMMMERANENNEDDENQ